MENLVSSLYGGGKQKQEKKEFEPIYMYRPMHIPDIHMTVFS